MGPDVCTITETSTVAEVAAGTAALEDVESITHTRGLETEDLEIRAGTIATALAKNMTLDMERDQTPTRLCTGILGQTRARTVDATEKNATLTTRGAAAVVAAGKVVDGTQVLHNQAAALPAELTQELAVLVVGVVNGVTGAQLERTAKTATTRMAQAVLAAEHQGITYMDMDIWPHGTVQVGSQGDWHEQ